MSSRNASKLGRHRREPIRRSRRRLVHELLKVVDHSSLASLIEALETFRNSGEGDDLEVTLVGDDDFGRYLKITYFRRLTAEEVALERKYELPVKVTPTRKITLRQVRYAEHEALRWGGDDTATSLSIR